MPDVQARVTLKAANGVNADACINTFAIQGAVPGVDDAEISVAIANFYIPPAVDAEAVGEFLNDTIQRTAGLQIELIESPQTPPNAPYHVESFNLPAKSAGESMPQEVCVCVTWFGDFYGSSLTPGRNRGRIYVGPLHDAVSTEDAGGVARPNAMFIGVLEEAGARLIDELAVGDRNLAIWSRADNGFKSVAGGWIDNEFDTQRRRGRERTARTIIG